MDLNPEEGVYVEHVGGRKGGLDVTIKADARSGFFTASVSGDYLTAKTRDELLQKVEKAVKKTRVKLNVPLTIIGRVARVVNAGVGSYHSWTTYDSGVGYEHVTLVGLHAQTGRMLLRKDDGTKLEQDRYSGRGTGTICRRLTDEEAAQYVKLHTEHYRAKKAYEKFETRVEIKDIDKFVAKKQAEVADIVVEEPEADGDPR